jgi:exocyst complex component 2
LLISEKSFDPKRFLTEIHDRTGYKDLERGLANLKRTLNDRNESEKDIVKKHFSKFVNAKSTVDSFYTQMTAANLLNRADYGIIPFDKSLLGLENITLELYGPVLERRL